MRKLLAISALALVLAIPMWLATGCASVGDFKAPPGQAAYQLEKTTPEGVLCKVTIVSGREVSGGSIAIGENCELAATGDLTGAEQQTRLIDIIDSLVPLVPKTTP